jgi:hypothetical protein
MNNSYQYQSQLAQDRFGLQVAARLSDATDKLPHDISERLRAARVQALGRRKLVFVRKATSAASVDSSGTLTFGHDHLGWWDRVVAALPLLVLVLGLITIYSVQNENRANEIAEIDAALLTDDLPPAAYTDSGFIQFLKSDAGQNQ